MLAMRTMLAALFAAIVLALAVPAAAHEVRPAVLELQEIGPGVYTGMWKVPAIEDKMLSLAPMFGPACTGWKDIEPRITGGAAVAHFRLACPRGLAGDTIAIANLTRVMTDVIVRIQFANGEVVDHRLQPSGPSFVVPAASTAWDVFVTYLGLGVEHILFGFDHLLFVFALVLLVGSLRRILITATAFTLAHSITLSLAALGIVRVPVVPTEALIALSIVFLAVELYRQKDGRPEALARPWVLAFGFGLLHGLGFASALAEIGLPNHEIPAALFAFNVGVEVGQIVFVITVLAVGWAIDRIRREWHRPIYAAATYAVGGLASFWFVQRLANF